MLNEYSLSQFWLRPQDRNHQCYSYCRTICESIKADLAKEVAGNNLGTPKRPLASILLETLERKLERFFVGKILVCCCSTTGPPGLFWGTKVPARDSLYICVRRWWVCVSLFYAAVTEYHRLGKLRWTEVYVVHGSGGWKFQCMMLASDRSLHAALSHDGRRKGKREQEQKQEEPELAFITNLLSW